MQNSKCKIISRKEFSCFVLFEISCYICGAVLGLQTYRKCFSQSLIENVEVFKTVGQRTTPISCIVMCDYAFLGIYPILFKCGVLYRLLLSGHSTTFD